LHEARRRDAAVEGIEIVSTFGEPQADTAADRKVRGLSMRRIVAYWNWLEKIG